MAKFMYVFRGGGYATGALSPAELQRHLAKWNEWTEGMRASGRIAAAQALSHPPAGKTVRGREKVVTDGPYAESKDLVSGILVVDAASLEEAAELARGCPILDLDGSVEVRTALTIPGKCEE
jgi:hypothetical protein